MRIIQKRLIAILLVTLLIFTINIVSLYLSSLRYKSSYKSPLAEEKIRFVNATRLPSPSTKIEKIKFPNESGINRQGILEELKFVERTVEHSKLGGTQATQRDKDGTELLLEDGKFERADDEIDSSRNVTFYDDIHIYTLSDHNSLQPAIYRKNAPLNQSFTYNTFLDDPLRYGESDFDFVYRKSVYDKYHVPIKTDAEIDCVGVASGDQRAIQTARMHSQRFLRPGVPLFLYTSISDCQEWKHDRGYIEHPLTQTEESFPLAFGIMAYRDIEQVERLLRAIYRPHNYYCIHLDAKSSPLQRAALAKIASCFENVNLISPAVSVRWGQFTVLEVELICMRHLWAYKNWKYYINLTGQEFPLKTNLELVNVLKAMKGANLVDGTRIKADLADVSGGPPHNITPIKGSIHVALNRDFVNFCLNDKRSLDFLDWLKWTHIPDETYFASLNHNPHLNISGAFLGSVGKPARKPFFMRYKIWSPKASGNLNINDTSVREWPICKGKYVRNVCILGIGDIHLALSSSALFANKFHQHYQYTGYDCLEELLHERTWQQYLTNSIIDVTYYSDLDQVRLQNQGNSIERNGTKT